MWSLVFGNFSLALYTSSQQTNLKRDTYLTYFRYLPCVLLASYLLPIKLSFTINPTRNSAREHHRYWSSRKAALSTHYWSTFFFFLTCSVFYAQLSQNLRLCNNALTSITHWLISYFIYFTLTLHIIRLFPFRFPNRVRALLYFSWHLHDPHLTTRRL
jgi:hypothetical protein